MDGWKGRIVYGAIWLACLAPLALLLVDVVQLVLTGFSANLGANPIEKVTRTLGEWGLRLLIVGLCITPAAKLLRQPQLIRYRRTVGLWAFTYILLHLLSYVALDHFFDWGTIGADILKRPYITIGMTAFVLLLPLAVTSLDYLHRKLGPKRWKRLHQLVYVIAPLGVLHYFLLVKANKTQPLVYGALVAVLLGYRVYAWAKAPRRKRASPRPAAA